MCFRCEYFFTANIVSLRFSVDGLFRESQRKEIPREKTLGEKRNSESLPRILGENSEILNEAASSSYRCMVMQLISHGIPFYERRVYVVAGFCSLIFIVLVVDQKSAKAA